MHAGQHDYLTANETALAAWDDYVAKAGLNPYALSDYRRCAVRFLRWLGPQGIGLREITAETVEGYLASLSVRAVSKKTYRNALRRFFDALVASGYTPINPLDCTTQQSSVAELYSVLEAVLPFAEVELDCLDDYVEGFPDDPYHAEDAERAQRGKEAIERARRLIANKTSYQENLPARSLPEGVGEEHPQLMPGDT